MKISAKISQIKEKILNLKEKIEKKINSIEPQNLKKYKKNSKIFAFIFLGFFLGAITATEYPSLFGNNLVVDLDNSVSHKSGDKLLAKGKGIKVYESEIEAKLKALKPNSEIDIKKVSSATKNLLINEIAGQKAIFNAALKEKIQNEKYVKTEINSYAQSLIKAKYLEKFIKEVLTEENIKAVYVQLKNNLDGKYEAKVSHILVDNEDEANAIFAKVRYNKWRFAETAKLNSLDQSSARNGGELGYILQGQMLKEFDEKVFSANRNGVLQPFQTRLGWHVVYVEDKRKAKAATFEQARRNIESELAKNSIKSHALKLLKKSNFAIIEK